jgi:hypothetical protein
MDLRHFLSVKPTAVVSAPDTISAEARKGQPSKALSPSNRKARKNSSEPSGTARRLDRLGLSPGRKHKSPGKTAKDVSSAKKGSHKTKKVPKSTPFDCFKLPALNSTLLDAPWEGAGHSPKLPFDRSVADLDSDDLSQFMFVGGLPELIDVFRRNSITGKQLSSFSDSDLEALGLSREQRHAVSALVARHL